ncbi:MAG: hypothetical protein C0501_04235 [Isosphaera sp.]|nr:hypothetical protein [Isosphaera sp.]
MLPPGRRPQQRPPGGSRTARVPRPRVNFRPRLVFPRPCPLLVRLAHVATPSSDAHGADMARRFRPALEALTDRTVPALVSAGSFATGAGPFFAAVADFNADGDLDAVTADFNNSTASVLAGNGDGTFGTALNLTTGGGPIGVAFGDFNGDGKTDLVIANAGSDSVTVFLNTGTPGGAITFGAGTTFATAVDPLDIVVADFDGDGNLDLATTDSAGSSTIGVLRGNGDGTFAARVAFAAAGYPIGMTAVDLDGDGRLDLAVALATGDSVGVLRNTSTSGSVSFDTLATFAVGDGPFDVTAGDFNEDGKIDLAVTNNGTSFAFPTTTGSTLSVLLNTSTGAGNVSFGAHTTFATGMGPAGIVAADFTQDGNLDLAVANGGSNTVSLLAGNGDGTFQAQVTTAVSGTPRGLAVGDLDGDGVPDVIVTQSTAGTLTSLLSDAPLFVPAPPPAPPAPPAATVLAAVSVPGPGGAVRVFNPDGSLRFDLTPFAGYRGGVNVAVGDVTGDRVSDIVVGTRNGAGHVKVFDGATGALVRSFFAFGGRVRGGVAVAAVDVTGDGRADLVVGAVPGGRPHVKVFDGATGALLQSFLPPAARLPRR